LFRAIVFRQKAAEKSAAFYFSIAFNFFSAKIISRYADFPAE